jgi:hypothetical protein
VAWSIGQWCPPAMERSMNDTTDKQISCILRLISGRHASDAFREIAKDMGCSMTAAMKRATKQNASVTITRLLAARA